MFRTYSPVRLGFLSLLLCIALHPRAVAQDVGSVVENVANLGDQRLSITGGINLGSNFYGASGIAPRRDNFQWTARANLNFSFLGISAPFSLAFSDANKNYNLPSYSFTGISPTYKWATLHAGDRSMSFSKYSMSGISFRGVGTELRPGKWRIGAFYGKLNRALASDLNAVGNLNGFYQRDGYGMKIGYDDAKYSYSVNFFSANDRTDDQPVSDQGDVLLPINNKVVSVEGRHQVHKRVSIAGELAHSVFNANKTSDQLPDDQRDIGNTFLGLIDPTESLQTGYAGNIGVFYSGGKFGTQLNYERISHGFRTLGALFFNNDTDNLTLGFNYRFLEGKLGIFVNGGLERTNLLKVESETTKRIIGSTNLNYTPNDKWNFTANYSNFRNDTKLRAMTDVLSPVDSIFLAQVTQSTGLFVTRRLGTAQRPSSVSLVLNHQRANSIFNDTVNMDAKSRFSTAALSYSSGIPDIALRWSAGLTTNLTRVGAVDNMTLAPTASLTKNFFNNALSTYLRSSMNFVNQAGNSSSKVFNLGLGATYRLKNSHRLTVGTTVLNRFGDPDDSRNFSEIFGQVSYGYNFGGSIGFRKRDLPTDVNQKK